MHVEHEPLCLYVLVFCSDARIALVFWCVFTMEEAADSTAKRPRVEGAADDGHMEDDAGDDDDLESEDGQADAEGGVVASDAALPKLVASDYGANSPMTKGGRRVLPAVKGVWANIKRIKKKELREKLVANAEGQLRKVSATAACDFSSVFHGRNYHISPAMPNLHPGGFRLHPRVRDLLAADGSHAGLEGARRRIHYHSAQRAQPHIPRSNRHREGVPAHATRLDQAAEAPANRTAPPTAPFP